MKLARYSALFVVFIAHHDSCVSAFIAPLLGSSRAPVNPKHITAATTADGDTLSPPSDHDEAEEIPTKSGPFQPAQLKDYWGQRPLLIRNAFDPTSLVESKVWPCWEDILSLASYPSDVNYDDNDYDDDDGNLSNDDKDDIFLDNMDDEDEEISVMSRLIRKENEKLDSFTLELGPFSESFLEELTMSTNNCKKGRNNNNDNKPTWTLLLNDVDRIHPPLSDWIEKTFGLSANFLPRWRRDDAMISIAQSGGGIGPHVDNYDVFLVQTSGQRQWLLGDFITTQQEMDALLEGLEVRILDLDLLNDNHVVVKMEAGDMLYLPPRLVHWGTALSDDCMTLSVGLRAPSASELVSRVAEQISYSNTEEAAKRYTDDNNQLLSNNNDDSDASSIMTAVKDDMKAIVLDAIRNVLDDPVAWDQIVGSITTEPKRPVDMISQYTNEDARAHVWAAMKEGKGMLRPIAGVSFATSQCKDDIFCYHRIFADGQMFQWKISLGEGESEATATTTTAILSAVHRGQPLSRNTVQGPPLSREITAVLEELLREGFLRYDESIVDH